MKKLISISLLLLLLNSCNQQKIFLKNEWTDIDLDGVHDSKDSCPLEYGSPYNLGCPYQSSLSAGFDRKLSTDSDLDGVADKKDECPYQSGSPFNLGCPVK